MEADELDQSDDLRLGSAEPQRPPATAKTTREHRKIEHQGGVRKVEVAEVDDDVRRRRQRPNESPPSKPLGAPVLIAGARESRRLVLEVYDS